MFEVIKLQKGIDEEQDSLAKIYTEKDQSAQISKLELDERELNWEYSIRKSALKQQRLCSELLS